MLSPYMQASSRSRCVVHPVAESVRLQPKGLTKDYNLDSLGCNGEASRPSWHVVQQRHHHGLQHGITKSFQAWFGAHNHRQTVGT